MVSISGIQSTLSHLKPNNLSFLKKIGLGGLATAGFAIYEFSSVPSAFCSDYNDKGEKVDGINWDAGLKESWRSTKLCAASLAVTPLLAGLAASTGGIIACAAGLAALGIPFYLYSKLSESSPKQKELIAKACMEKGINISSPNGTLA